MPSAAEAPARTLTRLGRYDLLLRIGSGGMAEVWAARLSGHGGFQRLVAIKTIRPEIEQEARAREMFLDEARIAASIHHPHVCGIFELGEEAGVLYMVMEWINGESLHALCRTAEEGAGLDTFEPRMAARILCDACAGLHAAHELTDDEGKPMGVVHRDVSPHNVLVGIDGLVKVTDFGVAKALNQSHKTRTGDIKGKPAYMPPEQLRSEAMDRRADVYALGCVLFEMTVGRRLFEGDDVQVAAQSLVLEPEPPSAHLSGYPAELERIVMKAVAREKEGRHASADELRRALEDWLTATGPTITQEQIAAEVQRRKGAQIRLRREAIRRAASSELRDVTPRPTDSVTPTGSRRVTERLITEPPPPIADDLVSAPPVATPPRSSKNLVVAIGAAAMVMGGMLGAILMQRSSTSPTGPTSSTTVVSASTTVPTARSSSSSEASTGHNAVDPRAAASATGAVTAAPSGRPRGSSASSSSAAPRPSGSASGKPRGSADPPTNPSSLPNPYPESP